MSVPWAVERGEGEVVQHVEGGHHQGQPQLHQPSVEDHLPAVLQVSCARLCTEMITFFRGTPATEVKHGLSLHMVSAAAGWRQLQVTSGHWPQLSSSADTGHWSLQQH